MYTIRLDSGNRNLFNAMLRQTQGSKGISKCGKYEFKFSNDIENPDFWIVRNKHIRKKQKATINPGNTILMLSEPKSVMSYPKVYCNQFGMLCSCQEGKKHRNVRYMQAVLPWFVGINPKTWQVTNPNVCYDYLKANPFPQKTKLISVITSNKAATKGHQDRIEFVKKLKQHYGDLIDVYGNGVNNFEDKWDVLAPYKYHISIENSSSKYYWTEKISDCYLAGTFPIYYGCTNIGDYFPKESYRQIDINDFEGAVKIIDSIIESELYSQQSTQNALEHAKNLVLDDYNIFNIIAKCCDELNPDAPKKKYTIRPAITMFDFRNIYREVLSRNFFKLKKKLFGIGKINMDDSQKRN